VEALESVIREGSNFSQNKYTVCDVVIVPDCLVTTQTYAVMDDQPVAIIVKFLCHCMRN